MSKKLIFLISLFLVFALLGSNICLAGVIDVKIASGTDDAEEGPGSNGYYTDSSDLEMIDDDADNGGRQIVGLHFKNIGIPAGATISSAYIEFTCDELKDSSDPAYFLLSGHLTENPESFGSGSALLSERPLTVAQVSWAPENWTAENQKSQTADISSIIQELVDQAGWVAGNALEIIIDEDTAQGAFTGVRVAESYDGEAADAAVLHVEFEGEAVEPTEPTISGIWFEAEAADPLTSPMETYFDDPCASGGGYIGVATGNNSTSASPAADGTASYIFDVPETGTYKVFARAKLATDTADDDSSWARIDGATYSSGSDWIKWNNVYEFIGTEWEWLPIHNNDDGDAVVEFTMDAGQYTLEIAYREDGMYFDAILITDDLGLDASTLPDAVPSGGSGLLGPVHRYSFDDGDTDAVDSVGDKDGTLEGTASIAGNKLVLDGSGAVSLPSDTLDPGLTSLTLEAWVELSSVTTWAHAIDFGSTSGSDGGYLLYFTPNNGDGNSQFSVSTTGFPGWQTGEDTITSDGLVEGETTHIACVFDGSVPEIRYYMDGELKGSTAATMDLALIGRENAFIGDSSYTGDSYFNGIFDEFRIYDAALTDDDVLNSFNAGPDAELGGAAPPAIVKATQPMPENNTTDLTRFNMLSWTPGEYADSHNVYFGTSQQAVTDANVEDSMGVLISQQQVDAFIDTVGDYGKTYYWRVDEVNEADMTIYPGNVWKFSTTPIGLIIPQESITATASSQKNDDQGPEKTIDGSGLTGELHGSTSSTMWLSVSTSDPNKAWIRYDFDQLYKMPRMLIWNYNQSGLSNGYGIQGVTIEYSEDGGQTWTILPDPNELENGTGDDLEPAIVDLGGVADGLAINALRITAESNWHTSLTQYGLSEVRFYYIPVRPTNPSPADDATDVSVKPTLTWEPGDGVVEHKVFFGSDEQAVIDGTADSFVVSNPSFNAPELSLDTEYFWRVEEVNMASVPTEWSGETWSFTTGEYTVVDDFESYGNSINNWSGGNSSSGNGAAIDLETEIANNGSQSMMFMFDDTSSEGYSEVSVNPGQLNSGSKWTVGSPTSLVFWVYGDTSNIKTEKMYVKLNDALYWSRSEIISVNEIASPWWTQVTIPLDKTAVNLNNVNSLKIGFIRTAADTGSGSILIDDIRLYQEAPTPIVPANPSDANLVAKYKFENNVNDNSGNGINGTIIGDPTFVIHENSGYGKALAFDANEDVVDLGPSDPFNFTGSFSVAFWANIDDWGSEWGSAMIATHGEGTEGFQIRRGGSWVAGMQGKTGEGLSFTTRGISLDGMSNSEDMIVDPPALNRWTHIVCIFDAVNSVKQVYFDSKLIQESATPVESVISAASQNASLGGRANSGNTGFEGLFNGSLDDVRIYNKALSAEEVRYLSDPTP